MEEARRLGKLAGCRRRPPAHGVCGGYDILLISPTDSGALNLMLESLNKRGIPLGHVRARLLLHVSNHATESMFQRLRTIAAEPVRAELRHVGEWLMHNLVTLRMESMGLLLSPSGVFPIVRGEQFATPDVDARFFWVAKTWIANWGLADNTPQRRAIAQSVRNAREGGTQVGFIHLPPRSWT